MKCGGIMSRVIHEPYQNRGTMRRSGQGLVIEVCGSEYFIIPESVHELTTDRTVEVVNRDGEQEGTAWFSPLTGGTKRDLTALIHTHVFVVPGREMKRLLTGQVSTSVVREFIPA
jgi:hypothetical protein